MAEIERSMFCENCGGSCRLIYDKDEVRYHAENCPFCGEIVGTITDEFTEDEEEDEDVDYDEDDDENDSWN